MKQIIKDTLVIFAITLIAGALLGFVNELTLEPIAAYEIEKKAVACAEVFFEENEEGVMVAVKDLTFEEMAAEEVDDINASLQGKLSGNIFITEVYKAFENDTMYGYVIGVTTKEGYNGEISFYTGITTEGILKGVSLLSIGETPGLGMNAESVLIPQFRNVNAGIFTVVKTGAQSSNEIDAITSATITSNAITGGVNAAYECFVIMEGGAE